MPIKAKFFNCSIDSVAPTVSKFNHLCKISFGKYVSQSRFHRSERKCITRKSSTDTAQINDL